MSCIKKAVLLPCLAAMLFAAAAPVTPASAQDGNIRSVTFYTVKPDRANDFVAEIKEYNAILAKSGSTLYSSTWVSLTGDHVYAHAIYYKSWADLDYNMMTDSKMKDQVTDLSRISLRINDCAASSRRVVEEVLPDFNISSGEMPKMIRVLQTQVRPDKYNEYLELMKHEIFPAIQKSETKDYNVAEGRLGESSLTITTVTGFNSWSDLDAGIGPQKALGKDGYQDLDAKARTLIADRQFDIYRFEPDLSYLPPPAAK